jgi:hypothetical protein
VVSFTPQPLYPLYPFGRRLDVPQSWSRRGSEENKFFPLLKANPGRPAHSLITIVTELPRLGKEGGGVKRMRNRATLIMEDGASQTACVHDLLLIYAVCVCACVRAPVCSACPPN